MNKYQFERTDSDFYMNVLMVSQYLHIAKSTIYKWVGENYIPHKKLGKRVLFFKNDIDKWVMNNGMSVEDLPEVPISILKTKDDAKGRQNTVRDLNPQPREPENINFKYRRAG